MDIVTMAMAKPKVIKLQDFCESSGESLNNKALTMLETCIEKNGAGQMGGFNGGDTARFFDSIKYGRQYAFEFSILGVPLIMSASITFDGLSANQVAMRGTSFYGEGIYDFTIVMMRGGTNESYLFVSGTTAV